MMSEKSSRECQVQTIISFCPTALVTFSVVDLSCSDENPPEALGPTCPVSPSHSNPLPIPTDIIVTDCTAQPQSNNISAEESFDAECCMYSLEPTSPIPTPRINEHILRAPKVKNKYCSRSEPHQIDPNHPIEDTRLPLFRLRTQKQKFRPISKKNLFGPVVHQELETYLDQQLELIKKTKMDRWAFDFQTEKPLPLLNLQEEHPPFSHSPDLNETGASLQDRSGSEMIRTQLESISVISATDESQDLNASIYVIRESITPKKQPIIYDIQDTSILDSSSSNPGCNASPHQDLNESCFIVGCLSPVPTVHQEPLDENFSEPMVEGALTPLLIEFSESENLDASPSRKNITRAAQSYPTPEFTAKRRRTDFGYTRNQTDRQERGVSRKTRQLFHQTSVKDYFSSNKRGREAPGQRWELKNVTERVKSNLQAGSGTETAWKI